jgi:hypothetical protein
MAILFDQERAVHSIPPTTPRGAGTAS